MSAADYFFVYNYEVQHGPFVGSELPHACECGQIKLFYQTVAVNKIFKLTINRESLIIYCWSCLLVRYIETFIKKCDRIDRCFLFVASYDRFHLVVASIPKYDLTTNCGGSDQRTDKLNKKNINFIIGIIKILFKKNFSLLLRWSVQNSMWIPILLKGLHLYLSKV